MLSTYRIASFDFKICRIISEAISGSTVTFRFCFVVLRVYILSNMVEKYRRYFFKLLETVSESLLLGFHYQLFPYLLVVCLILMRRLRFFYFYMKDENFGDKLRSRSVDHEMPPVKGGYKKSIHCEAKLKYLSSLHYHTSFISLYKRQL